MTMEIEGYDRLVCIICHGCGGHCQMLLHEFIQLMMGGVKSEEPIGFYCGACINEEEDEPVSQTRN